MQEVVVVFSDPFTAEGYRRFMESQGFSASAFCSQEEASAAVKGKLLIAEHSDCVDGFALLKGEPEAAVFGVDVAKAQDVAALKDAGALDAFIAPLPPGALVEALNQWLDNSEGTPKAVKVLSRDDLADFVKALMEKRSVYAPVETRDGLKFLKVDNPAAVRITYTSTVLPPKRVFAPEEETLLRFNLKEKAVEAVDPGIEPKVLFGVHPCDMQAILRLDWAFTHRNPEANYIHRRKDTLIIGVTCVPDENCFCQNLGTWNTREGYDAFLVDLGDRWLVEILTERGVEALSGIAHLKDAAAEDVQKAKVVKRQMAIPQRPVTFQPALLPTLMEMAEHDKTWVDVGNRCFSCGTCTLVCPTCYCFNVEDVVDIKLEKGERVRRWDSCQLSTFTVVATGENFRKERESRVRHRMYRKYYWLAQRFGETFCVGCGRCGRYCVANIHPYDIATKLESRYCLTLTDAVLGK